MMVMVMIIIEDAEYPLSVGGIVTAAQPLRSDEYVVVCTHEISTSRSVRSTSLSHAADQITWRINGRAADEKESHRRRGGASASLRIINRCSSLSSLSSMLRRDQSCSEYSPQMRHCSDPKATRSSTEAPPPPGDPGCDQYQVDQTARLATALCSSRGRRYYTYYIQIRP